MFYFNIMLCFVIFFVIFEFSFVLTADENATKKADDSPNFFLDYNISERNVLRDEMMWWPNQTTTLRSQATSPKTVLKPITIESTTDHNIVNFGSSTLVLMDSLKSISPKEVYKIINNLALFNKTVEQQILTTYGVFRPDKYGEVAMSLLKYFNSVSRQLLTPTTKEAAVLRATLEPAGSLRQQLDVPKAEPSEASKEKLPKPPEAPKEITPNPPEAPKKITPNPPEPSTPKPSESKEKKESDGNLKVATPYNSKPTSGFSGPLPALLPLEDYYQGKLHKYEGHHTRWIDKMASRLEPNTPDPGYEETTIVFTLHRSPWVFEGNLTTPARPGHGTPSSLDQINLTEDQPTLVTTRKPLMTTANSVVLKIKTKMDTKNIGYFTGFVQELLKLISQKEVEDMKQLFIAMDTVVKNLKTSGYLVKFGQQFENEIVMGTGMLVGFSPDIIKTYSKAGVTALESRTTLPIDIQGILGQLDQSFAGADGEELLNALVPVAEYPDGNNTSFEVATILVNKFLGPFARDDAEEKRNALVQLINTAVQKRGLGRRRTNYSGGYYRRDSGDDDDNRRKINDDRGAKYNRDVFKKGDDDDKNCERRNIRKQEAYKDVRNYKVTAIFKKLNDKKRNEVRIKDLIDNVKEMEAIKTYETMMVRTTENYWSKFDRARGKFNSFGRKSFNQEFVVKNNNDSNANRTTEFYIKKILNKKGKVANFGEGILKNKVNEQKSEMKSNRRFKKRSGMDIDTDRSYETTSKSIDSKKKHKLDKHTRHKVKKHLKEKHAKLYRKLKRRHDRKKLRQINTKTNKKSQNRFNIAVNHENTSSLSSSSSSDKDTNKHPDGFMQQPDGLMQQPGGFMQQLDGFMQQPDGLMQQPGGFIQQLDGLMQQPDGLKQYPQKIQPPITFKRPSVVNIQPPGRNRKPPMPSADPPDTENQPNDANSIVFGGNKIPAVVNRPPAALKQRLIPPEAEGTGDITVKQSNINFPPPDFNGRPPVSNRKPFTTEIQPNNKKPPKAYRLPSKTDIEPDILRLRPPGDGDNSKPLLVNSELSETNREFSNTELKPEIYDSQSSGVNRRPPGRVRKPSVDNRPPIHSIEPPTTDFKPEINLNLFNGNKRPPETEKEFSHVDLKPNVFSFQSSSVKRKPPGRMKEPPSVSRIPPKTNKKPNVFYFESPGVSRRPVRHRDTDLKPDVLNFQPPGVKRRPPDVDIEPLTLKREYPTNARPNKAVFKPLGGKKKTT